MILGSRRSKKRRAPSKKGEVFSVQRSAFSQQKFQSWGRSVVLCVWGVGWQKMEKGSFALKPVKHQHQRGFLSHTSFLLFLVAIQLQPGQTTDGNSFCIIISNIYHISIYPSFGYFFVRIVLIIPISICNGKCTACSFPCPYPFHPLIRPVSHVISHWFSSLPLLYFYFSLVFLSSSLSWLAMAASARPPL
jgi:hypothetical protein